MSRRDFLAALGSISLGLAAGPRAVGAALFPRSRDYPFSLGVASGYPTASGVELWTRYTMQF